MSNKLDGIVTDEQIRLLNKIDNWAQENSPILDRKLKFYYSGDTGWRGVAENSPRSFFEALSVAIPYLEAID